MIWNIQSTTSDKSLKHRYKEPYMFFIDCDTEYHTIVLEYAQQKNKSCNVVAKTDKIRAGL